MAVRRALRAGVERLRVLGHVLGRAGPRLEEIRSALPAFEAAVHRRPSSPPRVGVTTLCQSVREAQGLQGSVLRRGGIARWCS
jgi:hypothetical protein